MFNRFILLAISVLTVTITNAQNAKDNNGTVKGTITTSDGSPAAFVTVRVKNGRWGDVTNEQGQYTIRNIKPGAWTIVVTNLVSAQELAVEVSAGQTSQADFVLKENASQLKEVTVSSRNVNREDKYVAKMVADNC